MGMDGLYRPSEALGYTDSLGYRDATARAANQQEETKIHKVIEDNAVDSVGPDSQNGQQKRGKEEDSEQKSHLEEELKRLLTENFDLDLDPNLIYHFIYNEASDRFELKDAFSQKILLSLTPQAFIQVTENMWRNAGIITDQSA
jgi:hypothetical protein